MQQIATVSSTGAAVTYDNGAFAVGGEPAEIQKILEYDKLNILSWVSEDTKAWAYQVASTAPVPAAVTGAGAASVADSSPKKPLYKRWWVWALAAVVLIAVIANMGGGGTDATQSTQTKPAATTPAATAPAAEQPAPAEPVAEPAPAPEPAPEPATPAMTVGQENAVQKAQSYLEMGGFSQKGLTEQLVYEGFSKADAKFAIAYLKPNWKEQVKLKAESYMEMGGFSRQSLIEQLKYEGFTSAQAEYGAKAVGY